MKILLLSICFIFSLYISAQSKEQLKRDNLKSKRDYIKLQDIAIDTQRDNLQYALMIMQLKSDARHQEQIYRDKDNYTTWLRKQNDSLKSEIIKLKKQ